MVFAGSPIALDSEDSVAKHPFANNFEFKYHYDTPQELKCPIAAHIRKMRPRADLFISKDGDINVSAKDNYWNNTNVILRRSVTFGPEIQEGEGQMPPEQRPKRGIYFLCYQGDFRNGFNFLTSRKFPSPPDRPVRRSHHQAGPATRCSRVSRGWTRAPARTPSSASVTASTTQCPSSASSTGARPSS